MMSHSATPTPSGPPVRTPVQKRSRRTLERLLVVTEELLNERSFDDITVNEIVRRAKTSVGAFYARFRDKGALLPALYERYDRTIQQRTDGIRAEKPWASMSLEQAAAWVVQHVVGFFRQRRQLLRALALYVRSNPSEGDAETGQRRKREHAFLVDALVAHRDQIAHPDPQRAAELALYFVASSCRDRILFGESPHASSTEMTDEELIQELTRMVLGYLGTPRALEETNS